MPAGKRLGITNLLDAVVDVCRRSRSLADAGRALFANSRHQRRTINDSDRLRKYLARFQLSWTTPRKLIRRRIPVD